MRFKNDAKLNILKAILALFCITIFLSFHANTVSASIKNTINYQAKVTQRATGLNLSPDNSACIATNSADTCDFRIRIWNVSTGGTATAGNNLMFEELFNNLEIGDTNGTVNLTLNSICGATSSTTHAWSTTVASATICNVFDDNADTDTITGVNFNRADLYFELTFDPSGTWTSLASPPAGIEVFSRTLLKTAPSAFVAQSLNGFTSDQFLQLSPSSIQNTTSASGAIRINQQGSGSLLQLQSGGTDKLVVNNSGQLQLTTQGTSGGLSLGDGGVVYRSATNILAVSTSLEVVLDTTINGLSNFKGNLRSMVTQADGGTTTTGTGSSSRNLTLNATANFNIGNLILLNGTTYAKIDSIDSATNLTVTPALTWSASQTVVEYTVPSVGGDGLAANLNQQFDSAFVTNYLKTEGNTSGTIYGDKAITASRGLKVETANQSINSTQININSSGLVINKSDNLINPNGSWGAGTAGGTARLGYSAVTVGTKIYYWGGTANNTSALNTMDILDTSTNTWTTGAAGGTARWYASGQTDGTKIYYWGGTTNGTAALNTVDIYNISGNSWSTGLANGTAAWGAPSAYTSGKMYIWGGWNTTAYLNTVRIYDTAGNSWTTGTAGGTARGHTQAVLFNNKIYFWGGCTTNAACTVVINTIDIYDITGNSWTTGTAGGTARGIVSVVASGNAMYAIAGFNGTAYTSIVDKYDLSLGSWSSALSGGTQKGAITAILIGSRIYNWGGFNGSFFNTLDIFNLPTIPTWSTTTIGMAHGKNGASIAAYQGKIYIWGGIDIQTSSNSNTMDIYDPTTGAWSASVAGGTARSYQAPQNIVYNNKMYVWGGCPVSCASEAIDIYDFVAGTWSTGAVSSSGRLSPVGVLYNAKIYYYGGSTNGGVSGTNTMVIYDIAANTWSTGITGGTARWEHGAVLYNNKMYELGGHTGVTDVYDFRTNTWSTAATNPNARFGFAYGIFNNKIYEWGGSSATASSVDIYDFATNTWSTGETGGTSRTFHAEGLIYNGKMYVAGSYLRFMDVMDFNDSSNVLTIRIGDQDKLELDSNNILTVSGGALGLNYPLKDSNQYTTVAWSTGTSGGTAKRYIQPQEYNGKIYTWAGFNVTPVAINTMDIYDATTDSWTTGASGGTARYAYTSTVYNGKIYYFGGCTAVTFCPAASEINTVDVYNIAANSWTTATAGGTARGSGVGVQFDNKFYIWGGFNATPTAINTVDIYNFTTDTWTTGTAGGTARTQAVAFIYNGRMFAWGGLNAASTAINTVDIYDILGNVWTTGTAGGTAKFGIGVGMYNSQAYFWGGCTVSGCGTRTNTMDIYNPGTNTWTVGLAGNTATGSVGVAIANNKMYVLFGFVAAVVNTNFIYDFGVSKAEDVFYIGNASNVGPDDGKLFRFDSTGRAFTSKQGGWFSVGADYAEYMHINDLTLEPGDIVKLDKNDSKSLVKTDIKNDSAVLGVISTQPGFVGNITSIEDINNNRSDMRLLSMVGQVPVKVSTENGDIKSGDRITSSSVPGVGMKANEGDSNIGIAQQSFTDKGTGIISVLITRNNDGISNRLQINLGEKGEAGFRLSSEGKMQYKDEYGEWNNISRQIELDTSIAWKKIGDNIYNTNTGVTSVGVSEPDLTASKLQISKNVEVKDGLKFLKLTAEGTVLVGGTSSEVGFRVNSSTGALEYKDGLSKDWKSMSGILVSRMFINQDGSGQSIDNSQQISGWGYIRGDSSSNLLSKEVTLSTTVKNLVVLSNIIGYSNSEPESPTSCGNLTEDNMRTEVNIESNSRFNIVINNGLDVVPNTYVCFNWLALGDN